MARTLIISVHGAHDLSNKVQAIKAVRGLTGQGLKDAKDLVDRVNPGHSELVRVDPTVLEPNFSDAIRNLKESGLKVTTGAENNPARRDIGDQLRQVITYATMTAQYDISRVLIDIMETYCPDPSPGYEDKAKNDEEETNEH
jgi:hypothetical protein